MEIEIKEFYKKETKQCKNYNIEIARCVIDKEAINSFINGNIVKFIFFDKQYADISSDDTINEIHKFKAKYRGNTYVRIPISILKEDGEDYVKGIVIDEDTDNPDGYVVVSKHDLYYNYKDMRHATKEKRITFGTQLCEEALSQYNSILSGDIFNVIITDTDKNEIIYNKIISGKSLIKEMVNIDNEWKTKLRFLIPLESLMTFINYKNCHLISKKQLISLVWKLIPKQLMMN